MCGCGLHVAEPTAETHRPQPPPDRPRTCIARCLSRPLFFMLSSSASTFLRCTSCFSSVCSGSAGERWRANWAEASGGGGGGQAPGGTAPHQTQPGGCIIAALGPHLGCSHGGRGQAPGRGSTRSWPARKPMAAVQCTLPDLARHLHHRDCIETDVVKVAPQGLGKGHLPFAARRRGARRKPVLRIRHTSHRPQDLQNGYFCSDPPGRPPEGGGRDSAAGPA